MCGEDEMKAKTKLTNLRRGNTDRETAELPVDQVRCLRHGGLR